MRQVIPLATPDGLEIQHGAHQHDAVQVHPVLVCEFTAQRGGARGAIAFSDEELGRSPARILGDVQPDEFSHAARILGQAKEQFRIIWLYGAAVARAHGIDENQVRLIQ